MRRTLVLAALLLAGCSSADHPHPRTDNAAILVTDAPSGLVAVSSVGARNVRVLLVRGPSIVRLREVFVPEGEAITAVRWSADAPQLIVETDATRFALDPVTGRLARVAPAGTGLATRARPAPPG